MVVAPYKISQDQTFYFAAPSTTLNTIRKEIHGKVKFVRKVSDIWLCEYRHKRERS
ncbi:hypothetical protein T05_12420 [Trichinella murrelli]|uniref:Uncharacterized protein n=1 Tax=Trichinella murrelli TaxID=144512 RepID=A0A0V0T1X3_9BILA|nr:hypothetical protein T05_12420 [Trichinella murrelli]